MWIKIQNRRFNLSLYSQIYTLDIQGAGPDCINHPKTDQFEIHLFASPEIQRVIKFDTREDRAEVLSAIDNLLNMHDTDQPANAVVGPHSPISR